MVRLAPHERVHHRTAEQIVDERWFILPTFCVPQVAQEIVEVRIVPQECIRQRAEERIYESIMELTEEYVLDVSASSVVQEIFEVRQNVPQQRVQHCAKERGSKTIVEQIVCKPVPSDPGAWRGRHR